MVKKWIIGLAVIIILRAGAVGKIIRIDNIGFRILGVMEEKGTIMGRCDQDNRVFIPLTTAMRRLFGVEHLRSMVLPS